MELFCVYISLYVPAVLLLEVDHFLNLLLGNDLHLLVLFKNHIQLSGSVQKVLLTENW